MTTLRQILKNLLAPMRPRFVMVGTTLINLNKICGIGVNPDPRKIPDSEAENIAFYRRKYECGEHEKNGRWPEEEYISIVVYFDGRNAYFNGDEAEQLIELCGENSQ